MAIKSVPAKKPAKDFTPVFARLCEILKRHDDKLSIAVEKPGAIWMQVKGQTFRGRPLYYAGARVGKSYVSFYLMAMWTFQHLSPELKKRKQGKACFNFTEIDERLFAELNKLLVAGLKSFTPEHLENLGHYR